MIQKCKTYCTCVLSVMLLPLRKVQALLWRTNSKHRRVVGTTHACLDAPPLREPYRVWFGLLVLLAVLYYLYLLLQVPKYYDTLGMLETEDTTGQWDDIELESQRNGTGACGYGCDFQGLSKAMKKQMNRIFKDFSQGSPPCEINMLGRGEVKVNDTLITASLKRWEFPTIRVGGYHAPPDCQSRHKVAVIVPYRNNERNLKVFLFNMHPFLMRQRLEYRIFVVEQSGHDPFNKGLLINVGFEQSHRFGNWHCLVMHDVDLLPLDERILYTCPSTPRHMSATVVGHKGDAGFPRFGGVVSIKAEHFIKVNGYSNNFWGCCGVDSNMFWRIRLSGLRLSRYDKMIAKYLMLPSPSPGRNHTARNRRLPPVYPNKQPLLEGLSTLKYNVATIRLRTLYTHIVVDVKPNQNQNLNSIFKFWLNNR